ncbi:DNA cytosine methyltransferase [Streptomyces sp. NPDC050523]|uniref:DNA cytosine methyltransferase n=1 Tax=Streptomyces sp. NPDC050523 TaxID=3365622 RepID=UPI003792CE01
MIQPHEQLLAQRFPQDYIVHGNKGERTMQAGNAVSCNVAQWLGSRIATVL